MNNYNLVIIEGKQCIPYLNLTEQVFYDTLWEWTYKYDLWDYIEEDDLTDEELKNFLDTFIRENVFHQYEDDDVDCFAFIVDDSVKEYQIDEGLFEFIHSKIEEYLVNSSEL
jgi:hypothetical protein